MMLKMKATIVLLIIAATMGKPIPIDDYWDYLYGTLQTPKPPHVNPGSDHWVAIKDLFSNVKTTVTHVTNYKATVTAVTNYKTTVTHVTNYKTTVTTVTNYKTAEAVAPNSNDQFVEGLLILIYVFIFCMAMIAVCWDVYQPKISKAKDQVIEEHTLDEEFLEPLGSSEKVKIEDIFNPSY